MNMLILVRHGSYDYNTKRLDKIGEKQMYGLANNIKKIIVGKTVVLVSSSASMAVDSAEIISQMLNLSYEKDGKFLSDSQFQENLPLAYKKIQELGKEHEVVIVVTHHEYCKYLPQFILLKKFKRYTCYTVTECGRAVILSFNRKSIEFLSNN